MKSEVVSGDSKQKKIWKLCILGFLCVAIVGLVIGIIVVGSSRKGDDDSGEEIVFNDHYDRASVESDCTDRDEYNGIMLCIENDYYLRNQDLEKALSRYENVVREKLEKGEHELAMQLYVSMISFNYHETKDCDATFKKIDELDLAGFDNDDKLYFYAEAEQLAYECDNSEKQLFYNNLYGEVFDATDFNDENGGEE